MKLSILSVVIGVISLCKNWLRLFANRLIKLPVAEIRLRDGTRFATQKGQLGLADLSMFAEIWSHEFYTPPFFTIQPTDIVFDVGSNNGYFAIFAARQATQGQVFAFEPVPTLSALIDRNIKLNQLNNITLESLAMSSTSHQQTFYLSSHHNGGHSFFKRDSDSRQLTVTTTSLGDYLRDHKLDRIDLLKMDCEGAEYGILFGLPQKCWHQIAKIALETHPEIETKYQLHELVSYLKANKFLVTEKSGFLYAINQDFRPL